MDRSAAGRSRSAAPPLMIAGAALILIGSLVAWYSVGVTIASFGATRAVTIDGLRTTPGKICLVAALLVAALGAAAWSSRAASTTRMLAILGAVVAALVGAIAVYDAVTPRAQVIDAAARDLGGPSGGLAVRRIIENLFDRGVITIDVGPGLWLVVAGAVVALVGSILAVATVAPTAVDAPAAPAPQTDPTTERADPAPGD
jgi:hypothetical protein